MTTAKPSKRQLRGVSYPLAINSKASTPLYRQIYEAYRMKILNGHLHAGELVPSTREIARELRISRTPVLNAYAQLLAEGYFEGRVGAGTFVAASLPQGRVSLKPDASAAGRRPIAVHAANLPRFERPSWARSLGPFQVGQPALQDFPIEIWSRMVSRCSRGMGVSDLQYGDPMGRGTLREVIANYLRTARAVRCEAHQIMVVSGSQHALDITTRVLLDPGVSAWVEEPGYWLVHNVLKGVGCRIIPVPVDEEGLNVEAGVRLERRARAAFVAPSHQYPLGVTLSVTRRLQLLQWAEDAGSWIIEDDYDSEYRYDSMPITSLQGLDRNHRVIYIGTFSKVLFPSLRLGYIVIPPDLVEHFTAVRHSTDICPSPVSQEALALFIREGHFSRHIRKMRRLYEERRGVLVEAIRGVFGNSCRLVGAEAGTHLTLFLDDPLRDTEIAARAALRALWLSALSVSYAGSESRHGFVLGFGNSPNARIPGAVRLLRQLVRS
jgi:GntR family transcriptional regulator / MocR family aminotransferase